MTQVQIGDYKKDEIYYWDSVLFVVDGYIFRLPKHQFVAGSDYFARKYGLLCHQEGIELSPGAERDPIILKDVLVEEFRTFLKVFYPTQTLMTKYEVKLSQDEWISVLKLATFWFFNDVRKAAVQLTGPIERVCLAREYKIPEWLLSGYTELIKRNSVISETEAHAIGPVTAVRLNIIQRSQGLFCPSNFVNSEIRSKFANEFGEISSSALSFRTREERERAEAEPKAKLPAESEEKLRIQKEEEERKTMEGYGDLKQKLEEQRMKLNSESEEVERHGPELQKKAEGEQQRVLKAELDAEQEDGQDLKPLKKKKAKGFKL